MIKQSNIKVTKTARYFTEKYNKKGGKTLLVVGLHGYGQLAKDFGQPIFEACQNADLPNYASVISIIPEGLSRYYSKGVTGQVGASWMTSEDRENEITDYINYLNNVVSQVLEENDLQQNQVEIALFGFSQGGETAMRWSILGNYKVTRFVIWAALIPADLSFGKHEEKLREIDIHFAQGDQDPYLDPIYREKMLKKFDDHELDLALHSFKGRHELNKPLIQSFLEKM